jgi:large conductance mechanosensitive channel
LTWETVPVLALPSQAVPVSSLRASAGSRVPVTASTVAMPSTVATAASTADRLTSAFLPLGPLISCLPLTSLPFCPLHVTLTPRAGWGTLPNRAGQARIETLVRGCRGCHHPGNSTQEDANPMKGFKEFILRGNVVDLAVAVIIGAAFGNVVNALVKDILTPLVAAIVGKPSFQNLKFTVNHSTFQYGDLINYIITFLAVAAAVYFFVVLPLNKLAERRAKGQVPTDELPPPADDVILLTEIRDLLARQHGASAAD